MQAAHIGPLLALSLAGCGGTEPELESEPTASVDLGWIESLATHPSVFSELMTATGRDGWIAMHAHDDARATAHFASDATLRSRPAWKVAMLERDLAKLSETAHQRLFERWSARGELPPGGAAIAGWAAWCSGDEPDAWLSKVGGDDPGRPIAERIQTPASGWKPPETEAERRISAHREALFGDVGADWDRPEVPVLVVDGEVKRVWYDPCFHRVASGHAERVATENGFAVAARGWTTAGLGGVLFAPWLDADDLAAELDADTPPHAWGATGAARHGLTQTTGLPGTGDDAQAAREQAREVADALVARKQQLERAAPEDGKALLIELRLGEHWRQQWHLAQARAALEADHPAQALAYAELGTDFANEAGPLNPPGLYAVRANALLTLGRSREALDALHRIDTHRGVAQLREVVADLVVLEGLDRAGDSKEN